MPTVKTTSGYRFFLYSNETNEAPHIHVKSAEKEAKFWLETMELASNYKFNKTEINALTKIINDNKCAFLKAWNDYFA